MRFKMRLTTTVAKAYTLCMVNWGLFLGCVKPMSEKRAGVASSINRKYNGQGPDL